MFAGENAYKNFQVKYFINKNNKEAIRQAKNTSGNRATAIASYARNKAG